MHGGKRHSGAIRGRVGAVRKALSTGSEQLNRFSDDRTAVECVRCGCSEVPETSNGRFKMHHNSDLPSRNSLFSPDFVSFPAYSDRIAPQKSVSAVSMQADRVPDGPVGRSVASGIDLIRILAAERRICSPYDSCRSF